MGEMISTIRQAGADFVERMQDAIENKVRLAAVVVGMGGLAVAGCGGSGETKTVTEPAQTIEAAAATTGQANNDCGVEVNLNANRANEKFGSNEALFPSLKTVENGKDTL